MNYKQEINVPVSYFYQQLIDSARQDVEKYSKNKKNIENLEGISYVKNQGTNKEFAVEIQTTKKNECYKFVCKSINRTFTSEYLIKATSDNSCFVSYSEVIDSKGSFLKLNDAILEKFVSKSKKKRIAAVFSTIETNYQLNL
ncbi:DUF3284 domain-containing protein [Enterococcus sp. LJL99]